MSPEGMLDLEDADIFLHASEKSASAASYGDIGREQEIRRREKMDSWENDPSSRRHAMYGMVDPQDYLMGRADHAGVTSRAVKGTKHWEDTEKAMIELAADKENKK